MKNLTKFDCNLTGLNKFARSVANEANVGDIFLLKGELGAGKTTFARGLINSLYEINKIKKNHNIKSPSFPIMINYPLLDYEVRHFDLFRITNKFELIEIDIFEDIEKNISIIEWPEIILNNYKINKYYLIEFNIIDLLNRSVKMSFFDEHIV